MNGVESMIGAYFALGIICMAVSAANFWAGLVAWVIGSILLYPVE